MTVLTGLSAGQAWYSESVMLRLAVQFGGRRRFFEDRSSSVWVGRSPGNQVRLPNPRVMDRHVVFRERRGAVIVSPFGRSRVEIRGEVIRAPVVAGPDEPVGVGPYRVTARSLPDHHRGFVGRSTSVGTLAAEIGHPEKGVRRYRTRDGAWDVIVPEAVAPADWLARVAAGHAHGRPLRREELGRPAFAVPLADGIAAADVVAAATQGKIRLPTEALTVVVAELKRRLASLASPHGGVWPETVWFGVDGSVVLLPAGPEPDAVDPLVDAFFTPGRRAGAPPTADDDAHAVAVLARALDPDQKGPAWLFDASVRDAEAVRTMAAREGFDPAAHHLARVVRVARAVVEGEAGL